MRGGGSYERGTPVHVFLRNKRSSSSIFEFLRNKQAFFGKFLNCARNKQAFFEKFLNSSRNKQAFFGKFLVCVRKKQAFSESPHLMSEVPLYMYARS